MVDFLSIQEDEAVADVTNKGGMWIHVPCKIGKQ